MFNTSTSDRCGKSLLSLHIQNVPRQWPWCPALLWQDMVFQTLQTGSWEGTSSTDRVVKAKSQSQRHFRTFVVSKGSIFLACFEFENPKAWFMWSGSWQGLQCRCTRSLESAVLWVWAVRSTHRVKSCFGKLGAPLPPSLTPSAFHMRLFLLVHSWVSVIWSVLNFNNKSKLVLLNQLPSL